MVTLRLIRICATTLVQRFEYYWEMAHCDQAIALSPRLGKDNRTRQCVPARPNFWHTTTMTRVNHAHGPLRGRGRQPYPVLSRSARQLRSMVSRARRDLDAFRHVDE